MMTWSACTHACTSCRQSHVSTHKKAWKHLEPTWGACTCACNVLTLFYRYNVLAVQISQGFFLVFLKSDLHSIDCNFSIKMFFLKLLFALDSPRYRTIIFAHDNLVDIDASSVRASETSLKIVLHESMLRNSTTRGQRIKHYKLFSGTTLPDAMYFISKKQSRKKSIFTKVTVSTTLWIFMKIHVLVFLQKKTCVGGFRTRTNQIQYWTPHVQSATTFVQRVHFSQTFFCLKGHCSNFEFQSGKILKHICWRFASETFYT